MALVRSLWLLPVAFALHEAEEWSILGWYQTQWTNVQPEQMSSAIVQTWLVFITLFGFAWTLIGTRLPNPRLAAHVVMAFFIFLPFGHTVAHLYWLVDLDEYHPGVITAELMGPTGMAFVPASFGVYAGQLFVATSSGGADIQLTQPLPANGHVYRITPQGEVHASGSVISTATSSRDDASSLRGS